MNTNALQKISYGVYLITTVSNGKQYGCVANSAMQITASPPRIAISLNHDNATHDAVLQSGVFAISILSTDVNPALIGGFGYRSSRDADKFADISVTPRHDMPVPDEAMAWIVCKVVDKMDAGSHMILLGEVIDCDVTNPDAFPMTYAYFHTVIKGKSPKNAPTYTPEESPHN